MTDVKDDPSPSPDPDNTDQSPVSDGESGFPADRPIENYKAEMDRKVESIRQSISELAGVVAASVAANRRVQETPAGTVASMSDEDLLRAANAGHAEATVLLSQRVAQREGEARSQAERAQAAIMQRIMQLVQMYPAFQDTASPLYTAAQQEKLALVQMGYNAADPNVTLSAMQNAVVNNPDVASGTRGVAGELSRQSSVAAGQMAAGTGSRSGRRASSGEEVINLSQKALDIAARMGIKDPKGAMKRFNKRSAEGRTQVTPLVETIIARQEG